LRIKNYSYKTLLIGYLVLLSSCNQRLDFVQKYMENYPDLAGNKLELISDLPNLNKINNVLNFTSSKYKIICTGYMECSPCIARLIECQKFLLNNKKLHEKIDVFFIVSGKKSDYFEYQLEQNNFSFPILYDSTSSFITNNGLENYDKEVFLINEKNEIILVGSPFNNTVLEKYYKQTIQ